MNKLSKNISWSELACKDGTEYPLAWKDNRAVQLAGIFEVIRARCGNFPITILSAYRTESHNRSIGGARNSQHVQGRALDLHHSTLTNDEFYKIIKGLSEVVWIRGIGKYKNFVHIDIRNSDRVITWSGNGKKDS